MIARLPAVTEKLLEDGVGIDHTRSCDVGTLCRQGERDVCWAQSLTGALLPPLARSHSKRVEEGQSPSPGLGRAQVIPAPAAPPEQLWRKPFSTDGFDLCLQQCNMFDEPCQFDGIDLVLC